MGDFTAETNRCVSGNPEASEAPQFGKQIEVNGSDIGELSVK